jgi:hypothetical protein
MNVRTWSELDRVRTGSNGGVLSHSSKTFLRLEISGAHHKSMWYDESIVQIIIIHSNTRCWVISFTPRPCYPLTRRLSGPHCYCGADANRLRLYSRPAAFTWNGRSAEQPDFDMFSAGTQKLSLVELGTRLAESTVLLLHYRDGRISKDHVRDGRRSETLTKQVMYV